MMQYGRELKWLRHFNATGIERYGKKGNPGQQKSGIRYRNMIATVFAKDTEFNGDLAFSKSLQINGRFDGENHQRGLSGSGGRSRGKGQYQGKKP
jgi:hypothetical protein